MTVETTQVNAKWGSGMAFNCKPAACLTVNYFAGTDMSGVTTWVNRTGSEWSIRAIESCSSDGIARALKGQSILGTVSHSSPSSATSPTKGSYRIYGSCHPRGNPSYFDWSTADQPWDGIPPPVCGLSGPDVIDFGELKPAAVSGKSKKARYTISCDKKATVKVTFVFASGSSSEKIADDLTLALKVGTKDGVKGQTYTVEKSAVQADLNVDLKSGGAAPVGEYQASAVVKLTVE